MRWPFGPPHLTLKPSKKKKNYPPKKSFSVISQKFLFLFWGFQNFFVLTTWPKKRAPQNTIQIGFSASHFLKTVMRHETAIFGPKNEIQKFHLFSFGSFLSFNNKTLLRPLFYSVLANLKRKKQQTTYNTEMLEKQFLHPISEICLIIGHPKKQKMITELAKNRLKSL